MRTSAVIFGFVIIIGFIILLPNYSNAAGTCICSSGLEIPGVAGVPPGTTFCSGQGGMSSFDLDPEPTCSDSTGRPLTCSCTADSQCASGRCDGTLCQSPGGVC